MVCKQSVGLEMWNRYSPMSPLSPQQPSLSSDIYAWTGNANKCCCCLHCKGSSLPGESTIYESMPYHTADAPTLKSFSSESRSSNSPVSLQEFPCDSYSIQSMEQSHLDDGQTAVKHILQELETTLMGPDCDATNIGSIVYEMQNNSIPKEGWADILDNRQLKLHHSFSDNNLHIQSSPEDLGICKKESIYLSNMEQVQPDSGLHYVERDSALKQLLVMCAAAIAENKFLLADAVMTRLKEAVSIYGTPLQRLAAYMAEGLVARIALSGHGIYKALKCEEAPPSGLLSAMQKMYEICPYFKFGYMAANGAIAEAFKDEPNVHIIDFQIAHGTQWISLIQALANRPEGPPCVRITGIDNPNSETAAVGGLQTVGQRLRELANAVGVPLEFHSVAVNMAEMQVSMVELRVGEALAVNFTYQLHHMPDENVSVANPRDRLLQMVRRMNPKVLTLVEQEADTNRTPFFVRFMETLHYYSAVFESIDVALPRDSKDRVNVEQHCLARDIVNVIACENAERVERHELFKKWRERMLMAGFRSHPLSSYVNNTIRALLQLYNGNYRLKEEEGALLLGWLDRPLVVASAWH